MIPNAWVDNLDSSRIRRHLAMKQTWTGREADARIDHIQGLPTMIPNAWVDNLDSSRIRRHLAMKQTGRPD